MRDGLQRGPGPVPEGTCALWPANLVGRQAEIIDPQQADIDRDLAEPLHRIANGQPVGLTHDAGRFCHGLDHAGLIIGEHQAEHRRAEFVVIPVRQLSL